MAEIKFENYYIDEMSYRENENFEENEGETLEVETFPEANVLIDSEIALVLFNVTVGDETNTNCPFVIKVALKAMFRYSVSNEEKDVEQLKNLLTQNTIAILYPYVRSVISDLTLRSNKFPAFILPTINVAKMLDENDAIEIHNIEKLKTTYK